MRHLVVLATLVATLAAAAAVQAGGFATVGFAPLPDGTAVGDTWTPEITVLQHGRTPITGLTPIVTVERVPSGEKAAFTAVETAKPGVYRAQVRFPAGGDWRVVVDSGWWGEGASVTYGPFPVEPASPGASRRLFPTLPVSVLARLVVGAGAFVALRRTRRLTPARP